MSATGARARLVLLLLEEEEVLELDEDAIVGVEEEEEDIVDTMEVLEVDEVEEAAPSGATDVKKFSASVGK